MILTLLRKLGFEILLKCFFFLEPKSFARLISFDFFFLRGWLGWGLCLNERVLKKSRENVCVHGFADI